MSTLINLLNYGQSYWLDNLTRKKITSGEIKKRVSEQGLRGITSNPSIFNKAITNSSDYDEQIKTLVKENKSPIQIYDALTIKDVQDACDILNTVYDSSGGRDGFVSLEVSPYLARDTQGTIEEARRLFKYVKRRNCFIKIPGTPEGIPAIEQMLYEGVNINITLLFSVERYIKIAQAYIRAIERRIKENKPVNNIISVASIFISRIDVLVDELLGHYIHPIKDKNNYNIQSLSGKAGVATARLTYKEFKNIFGEKEWEIMEEKNAYVQRPLWASTSNKDPLCDDLRYVNALIADNTINTLPDATIETFSKYGELKKDTIEKGLNEAKQVFTDLKKLGIDMNLVTQQLENEGIQKFTNAYDKLISNIASKRIKILGDEFSSQQINCGNLEKEMTAAYKSIDEKKIGQLLYLENPYLWKTEAEQVEKISKRLGWLTLPHDTKNAEEIISFANEIKEGNYKYAVLMGMGGSSLCSEVARETYETTNGFLQLFVLDNTSTEAILDLENKINIDKTLFIVASKSGNTQETISFFHYFYNQLEKKNKNGSGNNFVAITDDNTPLIKIAEQYRFRKIFINPSDLGGRYSVLSDFGLLPMALMGVDIKSVLKSAEQMKISCDRIPSAVNPGISLGAVLGICEKNGRNKVTFALSSSISSFGYWVEQLLAESTGKEGRGLIPINGELLGSPEVYSNDRIFIHMYLGSDNNEVDENKIKALEEAGHPVVRIKVADKIALGCEYYRWEISVAIAGIIISINPFDQPNVEESKINTNQLLEEWSKEGTFKKSSPVFNIGNISIYSGKKTENLADANYESVGELLSNFTSLAQLNDYIAILPYFLLTDYRSKILQAWRQQMRDELKVATTLLGGPRYLHSTGQLHKGGPDTGLYIILIGDEEKDLTIPGEKFGFATLHQAQALGDFRSLDDKGRRVIRIHLGKEIDTNLKKLYPSVLNINKQVIHHEIL